MKLTSISEAKWIEITGGHNPTKGEARPERHHKSAPDIWWHGTSTNKLPEIQENGLGIGRGPHITRERNLARFSALRAAARFGGEPIVLQITTKRLDDTITGTTMDSSSRNPIPSQFISIDKSFSFADGATENFKAERIGYGIYDI